MGPSSKWIDGICPECSVEEAARRSLEARLGAVAHWLPQAAHLADRDIEHVHRLRVSTRRAVAAIKLYREWLPARHHRWMKKRLRQIRRAAGNARDLDVLAARLEREHGQQAIAPVLAMITARRAAVQPAIVEIAERSRRDDCYVRKTSKLLEGIGAPDDAGKPPAVFYDWAPRQLHQAAVEFFAAMPHDMTDTLAMHRFRIRAKALRYVIELLSPGVDPAIREVQYPIVEQLQERLGAINDHIVARDHLIEWLKEAADTPHRVSLCELACQEIVRAKESLAAFQVWWSPAVKEQFRGGLDHPNVSQSSEFRDGQHSPPTL
jgi:CHAD domain-containing protein